MAINTCIECNIEYYVTPSRQNSSKFCSIRCKGIYQHKNFNGPNNPNFGKNWDNAKKTKQSELIKSKVDDIYKLKCGSANRGKKFSAERIHRMHGHRTSESYSRSHTDKTKEIIAKKSKEKFTDYYKENFRQIMENNGQWIPLDKKTDYEIYFKESDWVCSMFTELYEKYKELIESNGIFNNKTNTKGVVRDHAFSRRSGFELGVFPEILRHIENCNIILHSENVKKNVSKSIDSDSISLEFLFDKIENTAYTDWVEQELCLEKIKEYKNGKRWNRKEAN